MKVILIRRKNNFVGYSRGNGGTHDGAQFIALAGITLLGPTLLYCAAVGQLWPLYLIAANETLGVALGVLMFKRSPESYHSCVPVTRAPDLPGDAGGMKLAA
ncbi:MAG TPA: hypothetical protein VGP08_05870 [Pyrinomonadaceae bacterium]|jgi:hypothetical protein|nr:hypothetical protein [Pyrinomonadaceae bacterium]